MMIHTDTLVTRLRHERERLAITKSEATRCTHPDDLVTFAAKFKAQAARVNLLEDILYDTGITVP
jgi:hypothetical protein